jgi:cellulose synthase/poly-beta-1,6-N-acetylglucosamine synthase-like glycosyltransferase
MTVVGGYVDAFYQNSWLDRYEITHSALNMGKKRAFGVSPTSAFYVPTCNMLVRKKALQDVGGLDEQLRVGEDVDLCWRLKAEGYRQIYVPKGRVLHKHRNHIWQNLKRRFDYGTSEAVLYKRYPNVIKRFPWQLGGVALLMTAIVGLLSGSLIAFPVFGFILLYESLFRKRQMQIKFKITLPWLQILKATLRSHGIFIYYLTCYLLRYYLLPALLLLLIVPQLTWLTAGLFIYPTLHEYVIKKPQLRFIVFLFFFWAEHAFYQTGVLLGCLKRKRFRLYRISFVRAGF